MRSCQFIASLVLIPMMWTWVSNGFANAGEIVQSFPAKAGAGKWQTRWRIVWDITRHGGKSEILYIKAAYFQRNPKEKEIKILGDCRIAECAAMYNDGKTRIYDIMDRNYRLEAILPKELGPACVALPRMFDRKGQSVTEKQSGLVACEVHDDHLRWKKGYGGGRGRRGEVMDIWSVLDGENYRYILSYTFRDDGCVGFRLGATAHNYYDSDDPKAAHVHIGCWRTNIDLDDPKNNRVRVIRYVSENVPWPKVVEEPFQRNREGGIAWKANEFTRVRIESKSQKNDHWPQHPIGYDVISNRQGNLRLGGFKERFTRSDFWVTRRHPEGKEMLYHRLPEYANRESLDGAFTLWHHCSLLHIPRDEDFGQLRSKATKGVALTAWTGFELQPHNLFARTPLYP